ncbi:MAG: hypothetical protein K8L97_10310 [Anaerolineae bacterium]|nr:hypothetical protein [Anaerolineae bacterium]
MSYQERNITVSLMSSILISAFYAVNVLRMSQTGGFNSTNVFSLWATVIVLSIITNIVGSILSQIVLTIIHTIRTKEEESFIEDERDQLIALKGTRNSYLVFSLGVLFAMLTLVLNMSPLVMFILLTFAGLTAEIIGDLSRLYFYRRGA